MDVSGFPIPVQWLGIATLILAGVQGVKKFPFIGALAEKFLGAWWGLGLAMLSGLVQGFVLYSGDGNLSGSEALQIIITTFGAMGLHYGGNLAAEKAGLRVPNPE